MFEFIYYTKQGKFETNDLDEIPWSKLHSPNEKTPAIIHTHDNHEMYYFNGKKHRLTGPASLGGIFNSQYFYLYGVEYEFEEWLKNHPNKDITFQTQMRLKYS